MKKKILILDDNAPLLKRLKENIEKFDVVPALDIEEAMDKLMSEKISIIAVDYDLGHEKTGDMLYTLLFQSGKSIPAMLFSGKDFSYGTQKFLSEEGFSKILSKVDTEGTVSDIIEKSAEIILADCKERAYHIREKVNGVGNGRYPLKYGDQVLTIDEWITSMENCNHSEEEELILKGLIAQHCLTIIKRKITRENDDAD